MKKVSSLVMALFAMLAIGASVYAQTTVGIVLPTRDEPRWIQDETRFRDALNKANISAEVLFSQGNSATEKANVEALISKGMKVLVICPQDGAAAGAAVNAARAAGVKVISYDRLVTNTPAVDYYVTFDSFSVGAEWGKFLVEKAGNRKNLPLYLYAGAASDNNAFIFFDGAWSVLQPAINKGTFTIANSAQAERLKKTAKLDRTQLSAIIGEITTDWNFNVARSKAQANLTRATAANRRGEVFVLAPNDGTARSIANVFVRERTITKYWITGQDAEKASVQAIINGIQSMTVLKDVRVLVADAIKAAIAFTEGKTPEKTTTYNNGTIDVPAKPSAVTVVDITNVKAKIIDSGYYPASEFEGL